MDKDLIVWAAIVLAGLYGWVNNIITLFGMSDVWTGEGVLRVAGIFAAPLGAILGYI